MSYFVFCVVQDVWYVKSVFFLVMFSEISVQYFFNFSMSVYDKLFKSYRAAHPNKSKVQQQLHVNRIWNENKKLENGVKVVLDIITELDKKSSSRNLTLKNFWTNIPKISFKVADTVNDATATDTTATDTIASDGTATDVPVTDATSGDATFIVSRSKSVPMTEEAVENIPPTRFQKPAQNSIKQRIDLMVNAELTGLYKR